MNLFGKTIKTEASSTFETLKVTLNDQNWDAGVRFEPIEKPKKDQDATFVFQVREELMLSNSHSDAMIKF